MPTGLRRWLRGKESAWQCRRCRFHPWVGKIPWSRKWQPTPVFLPGESHRQRSLVAHRVAKSPTGLSDWVHTHTPNVHSNNNQMSVGLRLGKPGLEIISYLTWLSALPAHEHSQEGCSPWGLASLRPHLGTNQLDHWPHLPGARPARGWSGWSIDGFARLHFPWRLC